ncbi:Carnitine O-palmitoyltransferase 1, muscle isoform [Araneus ventricosus]|uniref:Carnitine O-palmitoyltransferase 1, muscle isoform n=1 Tax=Araneus ventricosus TaxID=182803 RepID=A0A4Y2IXV8_ARAVE|nr:Carnitine O-palmitoyltransferase 1, muscle isoform [Araneus ventricosus]
MFRNEDNIHCSIYPAPLSSLFILIAIVTSLFVANADITFGGIHQLEHYICGDSLAPFTAQLAACIIYSFCLWVTTIQFLRHTLKLLLMYKGWMYEVHLRKISLKTYIWATLVRTLTAKRRPMLYSFQSSLPRLPLPSLEETMERKRYYELPPEDYLTENDEAIEKMETSLEEMEVSIKYLISKHNIDEGFSGVVGGLGSFLEKKDQTPDGADIVTDVAWLILQTLLSGLLVYSDMIACLKYPPGCSYCLADGWVYKTPGRTRAGVLLVSTCLIACGCGVFGCHSIFSRGCLFAC